MAEWTILIYMNGDNNLEPNAMLNFAQLAKVGSTEKVNFIVQFDRVGKYVLEPKWSQTLRFYIHKGIKPKPEYALEDLGELNMGSESVLTDFVSWGMKQYKAKHYMLVIWDHGQGWRNLRLVQPAEITNAAKTRISNLPSSASAPYRAVSNDETDVDDVLYNGEIHDALKKALGNSKLDIIGFDACLMAMVETAYAMHDVARYMVGSEELEPGAGWNYEDWAQKIHKTIPIDGKALATLTVNSYKSEYQKKDPFTTLSAFDLEHTTPLVESIDTVSVMLQTELSKNFSAIREARRAVSRYAPQYDFHHIDLGKFLAELVTRTKDDNLQKAAKRTQEIIKKGVVANYAGAERRQSYGSTGLAIYFPSSLKEYTADQYAEEGYEKDNAHFPVAFVQDNGWTDFLHQYWEQMN